MDSKSGERPVFPKRAVVTGGMPYGSKKLHFGHIGGVFIHADIYARFLRGRIGADNVIFVSGADCYGAATLVKFQELKRSGFDGTIEEFINENYNSHKEVLDAYNISLNMYAASAFGEAGEIHTKTSEEIFNALYGGGYLRIDECSQFFDEETGTFLNGRQVEGRCPITGCKSDVAYADECALGHQISPGELIAPVSVINGKTPSLKAVRNWYFDLERFSDMLKERQNHLRREGISRKILLSTVDDFLRDPAVLIKTDDFDALRVIRAAMPPHSCDENTENKSVTLTFKVLKDRETACEILRENKIRFRTGTTLVPFRLSGNVGWGIPVPEYDGISGQTFWVWPESLWAPISFVKAYLRRTTGSSDGVKDFWFNPEARVYQFIGEDNIYFYAVAEMGMFMAANIAAGREASANLPVIVPNRHVFFGNKKTSSSGKITPPTPAQLLRHYTAEQLRMHFARMALAGNSVNFIPKAVLPGAEGFDATLAEGNILTNVYNRLIRSCFYTMQKYFDGKLPAADISRETKETSDKLIFEYEWAMYKFEFARAVDLLDVYLREANKLWSAKSKEAEASADIGLRAETLIDAFHAVRVAAALLHPFAPEGTQTVADYLNFDERLWSWDYIDKPMRFFMNENHKFKFLEPRVDFFAKHPSQLGSDV